MKKLYLFAALAAMLAACSENDLTAEKQVVQQNAEENAVLFDAYVNRATTRAGVPGEVTTTGLKQTDAALRTAGFGVFGYYTDGESYSGVTKPNFFYNEQVSSDGTNFSYSPIKYWPNEFGTDAISDQVDRISFFAYAPWVDVDPLTGVVKATTPEGAKTTNITGMTRNNVTGDPFIKYTASMDVANTVDLCYGVAANDFTSSNSKVNPNTVKKGEPFLNVVKPGLDGVIKFDFKHALAQLDVRIDAVVNDFKPTTADAEIMKNTRIYVRSVTFEGVTQKGALNLNDGEWYEIDASGSTKITTGSITVYDGLKDGKEPLGKAKNESPAQLNANIIQSEPYAFSGGEITTPTKEGVKQAEQNLFNSATVGTPIFVIPTGEQMKVTIVYDVETVDKNLAFYLSDGVTQGSTVENTITKTISNFGLIEAGKKYILKLHLGMRSVDFDAEVTDWSSAINGQADLPSNLPTFIAGTSTGNNVTVPAAASGIHPYQFAITGLIGGESVTSPATSALVTAASATVANEAGISIASISFAENKTVENRNVDATWSSTAGSTTLYFTQKAGALGLSVAGINQSTRKITLASSAVANASSVDPLDNTMFTDMSKQIKVTKDGTPLGYIASSPGAGKFSYANGVIELGDAINAGQTYKIYVQAKDAAPEEVTVTVAAYDVAWSNGGDYELSASNSVNTYSIVIRGVEAGQIVSGAISGDDQIASHTITPKDPSTVGANGEVVVTITTKANTSGSATTAVLTLTVNSKTFAIKVKQTGV
jgi:hypothetical protein